MADPVIAVDDLDALAAHLRYLESRGLIERSRTGGYWSTEPEIPRRKCFMCSTRTRLRIWICGEVTPCCGPCNEDLAVRWRAEGAEG